MHKSEPVSNESGSFFDDVTVFTKYVIFTFIGLG